MEWTMRKEEDEWRTLLLIERLIDQVRLNQHNTMIGQHEFPLVIQDKQRAKLPYSKYGTVAFCN